MDAEGPVQIEYDVIVVGATLEALHVISRLPHDTLKKTLVIDHLGTWLQSWWDKCERLGIQSLRTPVSQHPHPSPLALKTFAEKTDRLHELVVETEGSAPMPTVSLFYDFCQKKIINKFPSHLKNPEHDTVVLINPIVSNVSVENSRTASEEGSKDTKAVTGCRVKCSSGKEYTSRAVVYTASNRHPIIPKWAKPHISPAKNTSSNHSVVATEQLFIKPWNTINSTTLKDVANRDTVIVGGGMTSALLALQAILNGASKVIMLCRRPLIAQAYDVGDVGWWGNKFLNAFWKLQDPVQRLKICKIARPKGSVTWEVLQQLADACVKGKLLVLEGYEVDECLTSSPDNVGKIKLKLKETEALNEHKHASYLLKGGKTAFSQLVSSLSMGSTLPEEDLMDIVLEADLVWLACGSAYNADNDPVLRSMMNINSEMYPITSRYIAGYPTLDINTCMWPGAPFYLIGRPALLAMGPASGDLAGMRLASDRIVASIKKLKIYEDTEYYISEVYKQVEPQLVFESLYEAEGSSLLRLEECGEIYIEPKPKISVTKPAHLIDISDLDASLPRVELQKYSFIDDDFEITVVMELNEGVALNNVRTKFGERSLEVWAIGELAAYRVHVPLLYGKILPNRCTVKVNQKKKKVFVVLFKETNSEWRFLKG